MVVDDHTVFREGIRALFEFQADIEVVAEASDAAEAVHRASVVRPDVIIMDVRLPGDSGVAACQGIRARLPDTAVLILTAYLDEAALLAAIDSGAAGYVLKQADSAELAHAVRRVACGETYHDPAVAPQLLDHLRQSQPAPDDPLTRLTATEQRILQLLAKGLTNRQIAIELGYAESTVKNYVSSILAKLEISRRTQAVAFFLEHDSGRGPLTPQQLGDR